MDVMLCVLETNVGLSATEVIFLTFFFHTLHIFSQNIFLIFKGYAPVKTRRIKCVEKNNDFGWNRQFDRCITCDGDLPTRISEGVNVLGGFGQCETYGKFKLEKCRFKCGKRSCLI